MRGSIPAALITVVMGLLLTAATASPPGDACSLITKADAAAALGEAATGPDVTGPMKDGAGSTVSGCGYEGSGIHSLQLTLMRLPANQLGVFTAMCAKKGGADLKGLGDVACWYSDAHDELHAIKGSAFVSIELRRSGNPTEPIKALMKKALERLK